MVSDFDALDSLGVSPNITYSLRMNSSDTMTSTPHNLFTGLDCTPGKAFIDVTTAPFRQLAKVTAMFERHARKIRFNQSFSCPQSGYAVTQPPALTSLRRPQHEQKVAVACAMTQRQAHQQRLKNSMSIIERDYPRIHAAIESLWGQPQCSAYIQRLILSGGDGMGNHRVGFKLGTVAALMLLDELHHTQFSPQAAGDASAKP
ncbi:MAG: hypothetical protein RL211_1299 [Pseudomonadota bacterium]|jgi:hypothetical protein